MRTHLTLVLAASLALGLTLGCAASKQKQTMKDLDSKPVNCATAEGDIRMLESEKAHAGQRLLEGATSIVPASAVLGILTGTEGTKLEVAIGEYNKKLDEHIALIKRECGM